MHIGERKRARQEREYLHVRKREVEEEEEEILAGVSYVRKSNLTGLTLRLFGAGGGSM